MLGWAADTPHIRAYFIAGPNLTPPIAALLHEHRVQAVTVLHGVMLHAPGGPSAAEAAVLAVALLSLLETAITAACAGDRSVRALGRGMFAQEIAELIEAVIAGDLRGHREQLLYFLSKVSAASPCWPITGLCAATIPARRRF